MLKAKGLDSAVVTCATTTVIEIAHKAKNSPAVKVIASRAASPTKSARSAAMVAVAAKHTTTERCNPIRRVRSTAKTGPTTYPADPVAYRPKARHPSEEVFVVSDVQQIQVVEQDEHDHAYVEKARGGEKNEKGASQVFTSPPT